MREITVEFEANARLPRTAVAVNLLKKEEGETVGDFSSVSAVVSLVNPGSCAYEYEARVGCII